MSGLVRVFLVLSLLIICAPAIFADSTGVPVDSQNTSKIDSTAPNTTTAVQPADSSTAAVAVVGDTLNKAQAQYPLSPERRAKLEAYSRFTNIWRFVDFIASIIILMIFLYTGLSAKLRSWASKFNLRFFNAWLYLILFLIVNYVLNFPFAYYREIVIEGRYGFLNQTFMEWFIDSLKMLGIGMVLGIIPMYLLYAIISRFKNWWLGFTIVSIPLGILLVVIAPVFISPMFNKFEPLQDNNLEAKILSLADKAGIQGSNIFEEDASRQSEKVNAYVTGLFNTKRIVLYDTLVKYFTADEILFVVGHEMGHYVLNHVWIGLGIGLLFLMVALWLTNRMVHGFISRNQRRFRFDRLDDFASLPLILLLITIISFVGQPITNGASRSMEHQADIYGMRISGVSGETAATAFDKLSVYNLSELDPNPVVEFWFYTHPSLKKRIDFVRQFNPDVK